MIPILQIRLKMLFVKMMVTFSFQSRTKTTTLLALSMVTVSTRIARSLPYRRCLKTLHQVNFLVQFK